MLSVICKTLIPSGVITKCLKIIFFSFTVISGVLSMMKFVSSSFRRPTEIASSLNVSLILAIRFIACVVSSSLAKPRLSSGVSSLVCIYVKSLRLVIYLELLYSLFITSVYSGRASNFFEVYVIISLSFLMLSRILCLSSSFSLEF
ncbi:MAG: hypothetical protein UR45_C0011G0014 [candidate division WS6 bacterium GW2011_WS6_33_547]|nr:MAG: hypothetical protein UR45_C0011G0014 [candidate division WS6 bacterium GW2011_WS6_33_547]